MARRRFAVIGLGEFGTVLTRGLFEAGHEVLAIDNNMDNVETAASYSTHAVQLDACDANALHTQELEDMDAIIIAITEFESLITSADLLRKIEGPRILARYQNGLERKILGMLGIADTFNPDEEAARNLVEQLSNPGFHTSRVLEADYNIMELYAPASLAGQSLETCGLRRKYNLNLVTIKRRPVEETDGDDEAKQRILGVPYGDTIIEDGDTLVLFGRKADLENFVDDTN